MAFIGWAERVVESRRIGRSVVWKFVLCSGQLGVWHNAFWRTCNAYLPLQAELVDCLLALLKLVKLGSSTRDKVQVPLPLLLHR